MIEFYAGDSIGRLLSWSFSVFFSQSHMMVDKLYYRPFSKQTNRMLRSTVRF